MAKGVADVMISKVDESNQDARGKQAERISVVANEVTDMLISRIDDLKQDLHEFRKQMSAEHKDLLERVIKLEHEEKFTRYVFACVGGVIALIAREVIPKLIGG